MTDELDIQEDELTALKAKADLMGVKYHPSIGVDALKAKLQEAVGDAPAEASNSDGEGAEAPVAAATETEAQMRLRLKKEATKLIRVRVACMNPNKSEWEGEIFTTGNSVTGTLKKYVAFDVDWHVPQMILTMMEQRYCQTFYTVTDPKTGQKTRRGKLVKEFNIEILPSLTEAELHALAQRQAMANGTAE